MIGRFIASVLCSPLARFADALPWQVTSQAEAVVRGGLDSLAGTDFEVQEGIAIHRTAHIEAGATIKGPAIIGPGCFVGAHTLLRGGIWLGEGCSVGPGCELKAAFLFAGARLAHFNFIGDCLVGADVNFEAGSIIANRRNERDGSVCAVVDGRLVDTACEKFGALVGDGARIGANAVLAPGSLLPAGMVVGRLTLVDQEAGYQQSVEPLPLQRY